jgi:hypothetical protein
MGTACMEYFYIQSVIVTSSHKLCGHHYFLFHLLLMHMHIPTHPHMCALKYKIIQNCRLLASDVRCDVYTSLCLGYQSSCLLCCVLWLNDIDIFKDHSPFILQELGSVRKMVADCTCGEILH